MEKTIFLFRRHGDRSRENFGDHYIRNHAPLGARLTRCLQGYTVNLVKSPGDPDAITEHWVPEATDLLTPERAYATDADFQAVFADDRTLFDGGMELYIVTREDETVAAAPLDAPLGAPTPEAKLIWLYREIADAPPPPAAARRVIDNVVDHRLAIDGQGLTPVAPDYRLIRMAWGADAAAMAADAPGAIVVREHRFIAAPAPIG